MQRIHGVPKNESLVVLGVSFAAPAYKVGANRSFSPTLRIRPRG